MSFSSVANTSALARAFSPPLAAISDATSSVPNATNSQQRARLVAYSASSTLEQLVECVPHDYQSVIRPLVFDLAKSLDKAQDLTTLVAKWEADSAAGRIPPPFTVKAPAVQFSSVFRATKAGASVSTQLQEMAQSQAKAVFLAALGQKKAERDYLQAKVQAEKVCLDWCAAISVHYDQKIVSNAKVLENTFDNQGHLLSTEWVTPPIVPATMKALMSDTSYIYSQVVRLVDDKTSKAKARDEQKRKVRSDVDVEMSDATQGGSSNIKSLVEATHMRTTVPRVRP